MGSILSIDTESFQRDLQSHLESLNAPKYQTPVFKIRDIPAVMRTRMGWPVAAKLMERWFNGAAYKMPTLAKRSLDQDSPSQAANSGAQIKGLKASANLKSSIEKPSACERLCGLGMRSLIAEEISGE